MLSETHPEEDFPTLSAAVEETHICISVARHKRFPKQHGSVLNPTLQRETAGRADLKHRNVHETSACEIRLPGPAQPSGL